jgi:hypothetical protein
MVRIEEREKPRIRATARAMPVAAVVLPVGIGDEADRGVEGQILRHGSLFRRVVRQHGLQPHQRIKNQKAADMEQQHRDRIGQPMLLALLVDAADPVQADLDRPQHRGQQRALAVEDARHVPAERLGQRDQDRAEQYDLNPADGGHGRVPFAVTRGRCAMRSEPFGAQQGVGQIEQQPQRHEAGERIIEDHGISPQSRSQA